MKTLTLHRGIAVPAAEGERIMEYIQVNGISGSEGFWDFRSPDVRAVRSRIEVLFSDANLTRDMIVEPKLNVGICACGSADGAAYYALNHNLSVRKSFPIGVEFTADIDEIYVDGRDFLYTAFQLWDRDSKSHQELQTAFLRRLFGPAVVRYFAAACRSDDHKYRIGMCDLASFDVDVVKGHYANSEVIEGRNNIRFTSAFFVRAPIPAARITRVYIPEGPDIVTPLVSICNYIKGEF